MGDLGDETTRCRPAVTSPKSNAIRPGSTRVTVRHQERRIGAAQHRDTHPHMTVVDPVDLRARHVTGHRRPERAQATHQTGHQLAQRANEQRQTPAGTTLRGPPTRQFRDNSGRIGGTKPGSDR